MSTAVDINQVLKHYGSVVALDNVSLTIKDQEFFTLLGPSGCGKTTLLRIVAGFESVTAGTVHLHGKEIENLPPNQRPVNTVFQQYSLFPHMTVLENVQFGLQMKGANVAHTRKRTDAMLELVQLTDFGDRKPAQLSGGQQQRVALARALAPEPEVLLLDEPLSALDLKLRQAMRMELKQIQQETGITFIFVTHDQEEALTMSDRIAVMSAGQVQQIGTANDIYERPLNRFVADFIGESNMLHCTVVNIDGDSARCELAGLGQINASMALTAGAGDKGHVCIRPERISIVDSNTDSGSRDSGSILHGQVEQLVYLGTDTQVEVKLANGDPITVRAQNATGDTNALAVGQSVDLALSPNAARLLID